MYVGLFVIALIGFLLTVAPNELDASSSRGRRNDSRAAPYCFLYGPRLLHRGFLANDMSTSSSTFTRSLTNPCSL